MLLAVAALHDLATRTVPNGLVAAIAASGLLLGVFEGRLAISLAAGSVLLLAAAILWFLRVLGGADAKLLGAVGLIIPPPSIPLALIAIALAGGVLCLPYVPGSRLFPPPPSGRPATFGARLVRCEWRRLRRRGPLPYAVAIAAGTSLALLHGA